MSSPASEKKTEHKETKGDTQHHRPTTTNESPFVNYTQRTPQLAPTKFRKLVWIKRNDFVIVECGEEENKEQKHQQLVQKEPPMPSNGGGFRYVITHILYKDQVKHIKSKGLWPGDPFFADVEPSSSSASSEGKSILQIGQKITQMNREHSDTDELEGDNICNDDEENSEEHYYGIACDNNGIVYDDPLEDEFLVNTNRIAALRVDDSSSAEDSEDD